MLLLLIKDATCIPIKRRFQKKILKTVLHLLNADGRKSGEGPRGGNKTQHTIFMLHDVTSLSGLNVVDLHALGVLRHKFIFFYLDILFE